MTSIPLTYVALTLRVVQTGSGWDGLVIIPLGFLSTIFFFFFYLYVNNY